MDLGLPDEPGHKVIERLIHKYPRTRVLVLTTFEGDEDIHRALENGALGYVLKTVEAATLIEAMRKVAAGQRHVPSALAQRLVEHLPRPGLSARETEVLELMAEGLSNKEIGARLRLAVGTVKGHVNHLLSKLGVSDRTHAVSSAIRRGFLRR
jgi:two-component system NarL family response regulator